MKILNKDEASKTTITRKNCGTVQLIVRSIYYQRRNTVITYDVNPVIPEIQSGTYK